MWNRLVAWLVGLNPFIAYFERKIRLIEAQERIEAAQRAEKAEERAAFLTAITSMTQVAVESAKATQEQARSLGVFLRSFEVTAPPLAREWDQEVDDKRYLDKHYPQEMVGLPEIEKFQLLLDRLNGDD